MIDSEMIRGYIDLIILSLLTEGDSYGYQISKDIEAKTKNQYALKETTLYSAMARLEKNHYIDSYYEDPQQLRKRIYYHISPAGITYFNAMCVQWAMIKKIVDTFAKEREDGND